MMKIDESNINHNALQLIKNLLECRYELISEEKEREERGMVLMTLGEIAGVVEMANAMKEALRV